jgi:hypothetical protein
MKSRRTHNKLKEGHTMSSMPIQPRPGVNAGGPIYQQNTMGFLRNQTQAGNIDGFESQKISELQNAIKDRVNQDKNQGTDPRQDQELAQMQMQLRKMANDFANINPGKETGTDTAQEDTVEINDEEENTSDNQAKEETNGTAESQSGNSGFSEMIGQLADLSSGIMTGGMSEMLGKLF